MDVVTLPTPLHVQADICVIADDLLRMVDGKSKQGTIYCVFTENVVLQQPFQLFYYTKLKSVTQLNNDFIKNHGSPMWFDYSHPRMARKEGDYIKFNFFQGPNGRNDGIIYTWTDFHGGEHAQSPTHSELQVMRGPRREDMNLYMTITTESTRVMLLSEKSFGSYLLMKNKQKIKKNHVDCMIIQNCSVAMTMFKKCGHAVCETCWARLLIEKENSHVPEIKCPSCQSFDVGRDQIIRLKLRQGPCPIDMCTPDSNTTYGAVLVPCGCRIHCKQLADACTKYRNNPDDLVRKLKSCPYDACKKMVEEVIPLKQG
ncbi:hypothetical protein B9Z55_014483 [Caenorhabditis nigoni]|uniref:RING-type domain-containing protein n=1 Tax=Caenorhabditis nigoni TaxID=1611254 RepID=A0A2G5U617_9PELO|nr:hypothetical protein B9Z55_014483 [Caenorhabditis nigoni]